MTKSGFPEERKKNYKYCLLCLKHHFYIFKSTSIILCSRSLLPGFIKKRLKRLNCKLKLNSPQMQLAVQWDDMTSY